MSSRSLINEAMLGKTTQTKLGFQILLVIFTERYYYRFIERRALRPTFLTYWSRFFLRSVVFSFFFFFKEQQDASNLSSKPFQCSKISQFTAGAVCCVCAQRPISQLWFPLWTFCTLHYKEGGRSRFSLFVLRLLCFHSYVKRILHCDSTSMLDPAPLNFFKHASVCLLTYCSTLLFYYLLQNSEQRFGR